LLLNLNFALQQGMGFFVRFFWQGLTPIPMENFVENLYNNLKEELSVYAELGALPVRKLTGALASISGAIAELKNFVTEHPFKTVEEEIQFFKYDKPLFIAEQYYAMEIFTIENGRPLNDTSLLKSFYEQELKYIRRFLEQNKFLYAYFQFDMKELDRVLFVRGAKPVDIPVQDNIGLDPLFTSCCDTLWGKFIAFERLKEYLLKEITSLENPTGTGQKKFFKGLKWTGSHVNLVELIYGLYYTLQLNNGNADVTEIVALMEETFDIKLRDAHHSFVEIRRRKVESPSRFLEQMAAAIKRRVDDDLEYKPKLKKALKAQKDSD
jgi:hypothetical protein